MGFTSKQLVLIFGMLITGTINTVSKKLQLDCTAFGYYNHSANNTRTEHAFNKPWFQTLLMFLGESLCLFGFFVTRYRKRRRLEIDGLRRHLLVDPTRPGIADTPLFNWYFLLPASCDLLGTTLAGIGLLFVDASIWQMMRGSLIIFAGILSIIFLKRKLYVYHWFGMLCTVVGLALVGTKSVFSGHSLTHTGAQSAIGIGLVMAGAFTTACQMIVEEVFLKRRGFHPLQAVGMEGLFGSFMMICVQIVSKTSALAISFLLSMGVQVALAKGRLFANLVSAHCLSTGITSRFKIALPAVHFIPGNDLNGSYENVLDALYQMVDSPLLLVNCILYILSIALFNYFGLSITRYLSAVHRTLIDALRTTLVWCISLLLYYSTSGRFGEPFDVNWGLIQIDGFACLIIGTLIYNKVMDVSFIPCCAEPDSTGEPEFNSEVTETSREPSDEQGTSQI